MSEEKLTLLMTSMGIYVTNQTMEEVDEELSSKGRLLLEAPNAAYLEVQGTVKPLSETTTTIRGKKERAYKLLPLQVINRSEKLVLYKPAIYGHCHCNELTEEHTLEKAYENVDKAMEEWDIVEERKPSGISTPGQRPDLGGGIL